MKRDSIKNIAIIIIVSAFLGFMNNYFSKNGLTIIRIENDLKFADKSTTSSRSNLGTDSEVLAVGLQQAHDHFVNKDALFIDARDKWDFSDGHIENAINIPEFSFEPGNIKLVNMDKSLKYIIYCSSNDCDISKRLANEMLKLGFSSLFVFLDGYEVWVQNGYPISNGGTIE